jgi:uncharacterized membrane protein YdbT with pleckstrin-like domain
MPTGRRRGGNDRYLAPGEKVLYETRRHPVVIAAGAIGWVVAVTLAAALAGLSHRWTIPHVSVLAGGILVLGTIYLSWKAGRWSLTRYLVTNQRVLLIEGLIARNVKALPLRSVMDTTYHRTVPGRLFGYFDLELNVSGHPGIRSLTTLPRPKTAYKLILSLLTPGREAPGSRPGEPPPAQPPGSPGASSSDTHRLPPVAS